MLVLHRRVGTSFVLDCGEIGEITVTILDNPRSKVKVGITAPTSVRICRDDCVSTEVKKHSRKKDVGNEGTAMVLDGEESETSDN